MQANIREGNKILPAGGSIRINRRRTPKGRKTFFRKIFNNFLEFSLTIALPTVLYLIFSLLSIPLFADSNDFFESGFWERTNSNKVIENLIDSMTPEELLGQVFFLGYLGKTPSNTILEWIEKRNLGGVKIFTRNVQSLTGLADSIALMQKRALNSKYHIPLFIATDQEGGWVRHIKHETSITPGNLALGAEGIPEDAFLTGYYIGNEIKKLGINMNFAPTADVYSNPKASVIGPRAFSSDPIQTALLASAYFKGMERAGIICTAKHFPGHGDADRDSHGFLPIIKISFDTLWNRDLAPYRFLIKEGLPAIMSGHLAFPMITNDYVPSSLSHFFQTTILREKLGFKGIVVTDDMEMGGIIRSGENTMTASKKALEAGNDMILISHSPRIQEETWNYLLKYAKSSQSFRNILRAAVKKILKIKLKYLKTNLIPESHGIEKEIVNPQAREFFFNAACRSVTLIKNKDIPLNKTKLGNVLLAGQFKEFLDEGLKRLPQSDTFLFSFSPFYHAENSTIYRLKSIAGKYDTIIFCLANFNSLDVLKALSQFKSKIIVVSALTPVYLEDVPWVKTAVAVYGMGQDSFKAGFATLFGDFQSKGNLPIKF